METVYIETTVVSYLVAKLSRDLIVAGHQRATQEWWAKQRNQFDCYVSQTVIDEASIGDPKEAQKRLSILNDLLVLETTADTDRLTTAIIESGVLPPRAFTDAAHIAVAAVHQVDFLITWNCKHIANAQIMRQVSGVCDEVGYRMPVICTPIELMGA